MIYKLSEFTLLYEQVLTQIYAETELSVSVFNVVNDADDVSTYLITHSIITKILFTDQVTIEKKMTDSAAENMKYVMMKLEEKSFLIILSNANLENAVDRTMMINFFSTEQICINDTHVFVSETLKMLFKNCLLKKMIYIHMSFIMNNFVNLESLISAVHHEKVTSYIHHEIEKDKVKLLYDGLEKLKLTVLKSKSLENEYWVHSTIFINCTDFMKIMQDKIFDSVMFILIYKIIDEAVKCANIISLNLAAGVFTNDLNHAHFIIDKLEIDITWINIWGESLVKMSVGDWKQSGLRVENDHCDIEAWVQNKSTLIDMSEVIAMFFIKL